MCTKVWPCMCACVCVVVCNEVWPSVHVCVWEIANFLSDFAEIANATCVIAQPNSAHLNSACSYVVLCNFHEKPPFPFHLLIFKHFVTRKAFSDDFWLHSQATIWIILRNHFIKEFGISKWFNMLQNDSKSFSASFVGKNCVCCCKMAVYIVECKFVNRVYILHCPHVYMSLDCIAWCAG